MVVASIGSIINVSACRAPVGWDVVLACLALQDESNARSSPARRLPSAWPVLNRLCVQTCCVIQAFVSIAKGCRQLHPKSDGTRANQGPDKRCRSSEPKVGSSRKPQSQCRMARHLPLNVSAADERGKNSQN